MSVVPNADFQGRRRPALRIGIAEIDVQLHAKILVLAPELEYLIRQCCLRSLKRCFPGFIGRNSELGGGYPRKLKQRKGGPLIAAQLVFCGLLKVGNRDPARERTVFIEEEELG